MTLTLMIGDTVIDSIPYNSDRLNDGPYLESLKESLLENNRDEIESSFQNLVFFIDHVPSKMNS